MSVSERQAGRGANIAQASETEAEHNRDKDGFYKNPRTISPREEEPCVERKQECCASAVDDPDMKLGQDCYIVRDAGGRAYAPRNGAATRSLTYNAFVR
jgi:hypothetical protein